MKKILAFCLSLFFVFSLTSCGGNGESETKEKEVVESMEKVNNEMDEAIEDLEAKEKEVDKSLEELDNLFEEEGTSE